MGQLVRLAKQQHGRLREGIVTRLIYRYTASAIRSIITFGFVIDSMITFRQYESGGRLREGVVTRLIYRYYGLGYSFRDNIRPSY